MTAQTLPKSDAFLETIKRSGFFDTDVPVHVARAPGRLDVMGGISDYSGSLVLQRPIREATFAAVQKSNDRLIDVISAGVPHRKAIFNSSDLELSYGEAKLRFNGWLSYVAGVFVALARESAASFEKGARIFISSEVPESKGVASSAALEVAVMTAICSAFDVNVSPVQLAVLCQKAENLVAGAPCGVMDQMTSACGEADSLLALLCQPAELQDPVRIPEIVQFWGIDSGERHAVSGSDYSSVRTGAFMGLRMIAELGNGYGGYLANISVDEFEREFERLLPEEMPGREFLSRYSSTVDPVTTVDPHRIYKIRKPAQHPVYEHHRVRRFRRLLCSSVNQSELEELGALMYLSHDSYSVCGLGSPGTNIIVNLVREAGPVKGLYGARITGGGSGGTVAVLGRADAETAVLEIAEAYEKITAYRPYVFSGSSPGASVYKENLR